MGDGLPPLGTKSSVPRVPERLVRRSRLDTLLSDGERRHVTLVSAPPGAGKTTLVATWLRSRAQHDVVPLTVDSRDNERDRFSGVVVAALTEAGAVPSEPSRGSRAGTMLLDVAFEHLERRRDRCVLVLDDVQELTSPDAVNTLNYLVERAPACLDVVLCSRADPPIRLGRLRLEDRLGAIRNEDLAFDLTETFELLSAHGLRLSRSQVRALWSRTQGWVAGLCLAAAALRTERDPRDFVQSAAASDAAVADYLLKELLARQDEAIQQFLLRTSVAERLTADLARELTDDDNAGARLAELERNGVFLVELEDRTWYRYHSLFAALLRARMRQGDRQLADELHRRAAAWYVAHDMVVEAEAQSRAAGDWAAVGFLASRSWVERTLAGDESREEPLTPAAAPGALAGNPGLALLAAVDACTRGDRPAADSYRSRLDAQLAGDDDAASASGSSPVARALLDVAYARSFGTEARTGDALSMLQAMTDDDSSPTAEPHIPDLWGIEFDLDEGQIDGARREAALLSRAPELSWTGTEALALLALTEAGGGAVALATDDAERALGVAPARDVAIHAATLALALCHALRGDQRRAVELVSAQHLPGRVSRAVRMVDQAVRAALGNPGAPFVGLDVDVSVHPLVVPALVSLGVLATVDAAGRVRTVGGPSEEAVLLARQRRASNDARGALAVLEAAAGPDEAPWHPRTMIERAAIMTLAHAALGDDRAAIAAVRSALCAAEATTIRAPLLVLCSDLAVLLDRYMDDLGSSQTLALELLDRSRRSPAPAFVEPLTGRETAVLRRLPTLMSNREIADGLHVSVNTVKSHVKSLYRKLGVANRREAVLRGRSLELL
jgi:LuxR family maltose regulon positive regulatory protein